MGSLRAKLGWKAVEPIADLPKLAPRIAGDGSDDCPPPVLPEHMVVVGSGVTGVEFVHMFTTLGSRVSLIVSRQQVLPTKDPEVAAALETDFLDRGVSLLKGARAAGVERFDDGGNVVRLTLNRGAA